jgi:hypothetical protein
MVGGYAQEHINDELLRTNRMADVWSSIDGTILRKLSVF